MSHRNFILICILAMGLVVSMSIGAAAQTKPYTPPKTADTSQFGLDRAHATVAASNRTSLIVGFAHRNRNRG